MTYTKNSCASCVHFKSPITAQSIIDDILLLDDPQNIRETLHELIMAFFLYYDSPTEEFKGKVYATYIGLYQALKQMETLQERRAS